MRVTEMTSPTQEETAIARLIAHSRISRVAIDEIVNLDCSNRDEHLEWLCSAPIAEIEDWAQECGLWESPHTAPAILSYPEEQAEAAAIVKLSTSFTRHQIGEIVTLDCSNYDEHLRWILSTDNREILAWAKECGIAA